jgi:hypothetical protein
MRVSIEKLNTTLIIDKLTLLLNLPPQLAQGLPEFLFGWLGDKEDMKSHGLTRAFGQSGGGYKISIHGKVPSPDVEDGWSKKAGFMFQAGPKRLDLPAFRLDINPGCLNPHGFQHLKEMVALLGIDWHWVQLSRVSRVDATVDVDGCSPDDFAWDMPKRRKRHLFVDNERMETLYVGSMHSEHVAIYDKMMQSKLKPPHPRTRIEFRLQKRGPLQDLPNLGNPLKELLVLDPRAIKTTYLPLLLAMKTVGQEKGLSGMLSLFGPAERKVIDKKLRATTPTWWRPGEIWKEWPSVLVTALPTLFDVEPSAVALISSYAKLGAIANSVGTQLPTTNSAP